MCVCACVCVCVCMFNGQGIWGMLASFLCHEYLFQDPSVYLRLLAFLFYINSCYKPHTPHTPFSPLILFSFLNQCLVSLETLLRVVLWLCGVEVCLHHQRVGAHFILVHFSNQAYKSGGEWAWVLVECITYCQGDIP